MTNSICEQCGVQFVATSERQGRCPICEDEREFVNWSRHHLLPSIDNLYEDVEPEHHDYHRR